MKSPVGITLALAAVLIGQAQAPRDAGPVGSGALAGRVLIEGANGDPARNAVVTLNSASAGVHRTTVADGEGRFVFDRLPAGAYLVAASKPGYVSTAYGAARPGRPGTPVAVAEDARAEVQLHLPRGAVITGRVMDATGAPASMAVVHVLQHRWVNGRRALTSPAGIVDAPRAIVDDRGEFRIYGLPAGEYVVAAAPGLRSPLVAPARELAGWEFDKAARILAGRPSKPLSRERLPVRGYVPVFHPGTTDISRAQSISLRAGEERSDIDLRLSLMPIAEIAGAVQLPADMPASAVQISMVPSGDHLPAQGIGIGAAIGGFANARLDQNGTFRISGVTPGTYSVVARAALKTSVYFAVARVPVSGSDVALSLSLQPAALLSGRLELTGVSTPSSPPRGMRVRLTMLDASEGVVVAGQPAAVGADGTFTLQGIMPARYRVEVLDAPAPWTLVAAVREGRDVFDDVLDLAAGDSPSSLVLTLSDAPSELSGRLQDAVGQSAPEYFVITFPVDRSRWTWQSRRIQAIRPDSDGRYAVRGLPAGEYLVGVVTDVETNEWFDPAFLETLAPAAVRVTIAPGRRTPLDLRIGG